MIYALLAMWILIRRGKGTQHMLMTGILFYAIYWLNEWVRHGNCNLALLKAAGNAFNYVFNNGVVFTGMLYMSIGIFCRENHRINPLSSILGIFAGILITYRKNLALLSHP